MDEGTGIITKRSSILDVNKEKFGENFRKIGLCWYFESFWEKVILIAFILLGGWKLLELLKGWLL